MAGSAMSYLVSFAACYLALRQFSISKIAPLTVGMVIIVVAYGFYAEEAISTRQMPGVLFGVASIILILS